MGPRNFRQLPCLRIQNSQVRKACDHAAAAVLSSGLRKICSDLEHPLLEEGRECETEPESLASILKPEGPKAGKHAVLVQGIAHADDSDLDHGWEKYLGYWRKKEPYIDAYLAEREKFGWFWKRIVVQVEPKKILAWKNGDTSRPPEVFGALEQ